MHNLLILTKNHLDSGQKMTGTSQGSYGYLLSPQSFFTSEPGNFVDMEDCEQALKLVKYINDGSSR